MRGARRLLPLLALAAAGCLPMGGPSSSRAAASPASVARFDWFEYSGRDSVYERLRAGPGDYVNPILAGFYPDPSITRVGEDYYLVTSTFTYFPGIPIFHSRDLVNWTQIGNAIHRPSQLRFDSLGTSRGVFAPTIEHHLGTYYVANTCVGCGGNFIVTATDPRGPWSDPIWLPDVEGIDPALFFDDDGRAWLINNRAPAGPPRYEGHRAIWIQEYDVAARRMKGPSTMLVDGGVDPSTKPIWIEGPHIYKVDGKYYLNAAEGGTAVQHSQVILRADSLLGPYRPGPANPILTQRHLPRDRPFPIEATGHADFVRTPAGEWWAIFLASRPYVEDYHNTGRETFLLPVRWQNGWPTILTGDAAVPYVHRRPSLPAQPAPAIPTHGNFTVREEFDGPELAPHWLMIRTPRERWHDFTSSPGALTLRARPVSLAAMGQPTFVGRRQQHLRATASTVMRFTPAKAGDKAGLTAYMTDDNHYLMAVTLAGGRPTIQLERRFRRAGAPADGGATTVVASAPLPGAPGAPLHLRVDANDGRYSFFYATEPDRWIALAENVDGRILSTREAGGFGGNFVGVLFGLHAYAAP